MPWYPGSCCGCQCGLASGGVSGSVIDTDMWHDFNSNLTVDGGKITRVAGAGEAKFRNVKQKCWIGGGVAVTASVDITGDGWARFYVGMTADGSSWLAVEARSTAPESPNTWTRCPTLRFLSNSGTIKEIHNALALNGGTVIFGGGRRCSQNVIGAAYDPLVGKLYAIISSQSGGGVVGVDVGVGTYGAYGGFGVDAGSGTVKWTTPTVARYGDSTYVGGGNKNCGTQTEVGYLDPESPCYADSYTGISGVNAPVGVQFGWQLDGAIVPAPLGDWTVNDGGATADVDGTYPPIRRVLIVDSCSNSITIDITSTEHSSVRAGISGCGSIGGPDSRSESKEVIGDNTDTISKTNLPPGEWRIDIDASISGPPAFDFEPGAGVAISGTGWHWAEAC